MVDHHACHKCEKNVYKCVCFYGIEGNEKGSKWEKNGTMKSDTGIYWTMKHIALTVLSWFLRLVRIKMCSFKISHSWVSKHNCTIAFITRPVDTASLACNNVTIWPFCTIFCTQASQWNFPWRFLTLKIILHKKYFFMWINCYRN